MNHPLPSHHVILSLGSNDDAERHLDEAQEALANTLSKGRASERKWTEAVGSPKEASAWPYGKFLNMLVTGETEATPSDLERGLKQIEASLGRNEHDKRRGKVAIDIDLLAYDDLHFHEDDWKRTYVGELLAGGFPHPLT